MHFPEDMIILEKWIVDKPLSAIYFDGNKDRYFIKRFLAGSQNVEQYFIPVDSKIQLEIVSADWKPVIEISFSKTVKGIKENLIENIEELISVKGIKALGNQLSSFKIKNINLIEPIPHTPAEKTPIMELEVNVENENLDINIKNSDSQEGQTELDF